MAIVVAVLLAFVAGFAVGFAFLAWCIVDARIERRRDARAGRLHVHKGGRS